MVALQALCGREKTMSPKWECGYPGCREHPYLVFIIKRSEGQGEEGPPLFASEEDVRVFSCLSHSNYSWQVAAGLASGLKKLLVELNLLREEDKVVITEIVLRGDPFKNSKQILEEY